MILPELLLTSKYNKKQTRVNIDTRTEVKKKSGTEIFPLELWVNKYVFMEEEKL